MPDRFWQTLYAGLKYCSPEDYRQAVNGATTDMAMRTLLQAAGVTTRQLMQIEKCTYKSLEKLMRGERDNGVL